MRTLQCNHALLALLRLFHYCKLALYFAVQHLRANQYMLKLMYVGGVYFTVLYWFASHYTNLLS